VKKLNTKIKATLVACVMVCSGSVFAEAVNYCEYGYRVNDTVPDISMVNDVDIYIGDNSLNPQWKNAIIEAVDDLNFQFNLISSAVTLSVNENNYSSDINIFMISFPQYGLQANAPANADLGSQYGIGEQILINTFKYTTEEIPYNEKVIIIQHEILHTLGVEHTNTPSGKLVSQTNKSPICNNQKYGPSMMVESGHYKLNAVDMYVIKKLFPK